MARVFLVVIDSVGIGGAPDAHQFFNGAKPDLGANTVGHIAQACADGLADIGRNGPLAVPILDKMGLGRAVRLGSNLSSPGLYAVPNGAWGAATEVSQGKDTPSGHWELAGVPVPWDWHIFPNVDPAFPDDLIVEICEKAGTGGTLGNCYASGTDIIEDQGARHLKTGWPICYTSVDSVLQIAAHEDHFGFKGENVSTFKRTANRKDFAIDPPAPTICDDAHAAGREVHAIGKIGDIFSMRGITDVAKGRDRELMAHLNARVDHAADGSLTFANFVEFDSEYGHRRDVAGYARHLEWFDEALGILLPKLREDDMLIVTADHGNDPTWDGTDHTRERVPVLVHGIGKKELGQIAFVDVAASVAHHLNIPHSGKGRSFL